MIKSALSLQNKIDQKFTSRTDKFIDEFSVEALANAGQRLGMKGDSITYSSFTLKELLTEAGKDQLLLSGLDYNCVVKYKKTNVGDKQAIATMCVVPAGEIYDESNSLDNASLLNVDENETINLFDEHYIAQEFKFDKSINNIDYFVENSFLTVNGNIFKTFLFGKKLGFKDNEDFNLEIMYNEFDLSDNMLERAVRMYHLFSLANSNYYATIDIQRNHDRQLDDSDESFILKIFIMNDKSLSVTEDNINASELKKAFSLRELKNQINEAKSSNDQEMFKNLYNKYININDSKSYFNYVNEDSSLYKIISTYDVCQTNLQKAVHIEDLLNYDVATHAILKQTSMLDKSIIGENLVELSNKIAAYLKRNGVEEDINEAVAQIYRDTSYYAAIVKNNQASDFSTNLKYNSSKNVITSVASGYIKDEIRNLLDSDYIGIDKRIEYINNDIVYLFPKLLQKYNEVSFGTKDKIIKSVVMRLYEKIHESTDLDYGTLYIPLDYSFNYIANNNNELEIFYSSDIYVNLDNLDNLEDSNKQQLLADTSTIFYDYDGESKSKLFKFEVDYNSMYNDIINNIYVYYLHTFPFINAKNTWSVNDFDTNVPAVAQIIHKQNLVILFNSCDEERENFNYKFLNVTDTKIFNIEKWEKTSINFDDSTELTYSVPRINVNTNLDQFIGCTILLICDSTCAKSKIEKELPNNVLYTLFLTVAHSEDENTYHFVPVYVDNNNLLDLSKVINIDSLVETVSKLVQTNNKEFDYLVISNRTDKLLHGQNSKFDSLVLALSTPKETIDNIVNILNDSTKKPDDKVKTLKAEDNTEDNEEDSSTEEDNKDTSNSYYYKIDREYDNKLTFALKCVNNERLKDLSSIKSDEDGKYLQLDNVPVYATMYPYPKEESLITEESYETIRIIKNGDNSVSFEKVIVSKLEKDDYWDVRNEQGIYIDRLQKTTEEEIVSVKGYEYEEVQIKKEGDIVRIDDTVANPLDYMPEYVFNSDVPLMNLKEMIMLNANVLNRMNIISLNEDGKLFNGYIGTDFRSNLKNQLLLTSSRENINLGNDTLISIDDSINLEKYDSIKIVFDEIHNDSKLFTTTSSLVKTTRVGEVDVYDFNDKIFGEAYSTTWIDSQNNETYKSLFNVNRSTISLKDINAFSEKENNKTKYNYLNECFDEPNDAGKYVEMIYTYSSDKRWLVVNWINVLKNLKVNANEYKITFNDRLVNTVELKELPSKEFDIDSFIHYYYDSDNQIIGENLGSNIEQSVVSAYFDSIDCVDIKMVDKSYFISVIYNQKYTTTGLWDGHNYNVISMGDKKIVSISKDIEIVYYVEDGVCYASIYDANNIFTKFSWVTNE